MIFLRLSIASLAGFLAAAAYSQATPTFNIQTSGACRTLFVGDPLTSTDVAIGCAQNGRFTSNIINGGDYYSFFAAGALGSTTTSAVPEKVYAGVRIDYDSWSQVGNGGSIGSKVDGFGVLLNTTGVAQTIRGGRHAIYGGLILNSPSAADNADRNYVGIQAQGISVAGDGGTLAAPQGALFGGSSTAELRSGATGMLNVTSWEFDVLTQPGSSVVYRSGIQINPYLNVRGSVYDCDICLSHIGGSPLKSKVLILAGPMNGLTPVGADTDIIAIDPGTTAAHSFFYAPTLTFSGEIIATATATFGTNGVRAQAPNAGVLLGSPSSGGTPYLNFLSSGSAPTFDSRIIASGGNSSNGNGFLTFAASVVALPEARPLEDAVFRLGAPDFRWGKLYTNKVIVSSNPPITAASSCEQGEITWDTGYLYVCVSANRWKRTSLSSW